MKVNVVVDTSSFDPHRATWRRGFSGWAAAAAAAAAVDDDDATDVSVYVGCHSDLSNNQLVSLPELAFANLTDLNTLSVPLYISLSHIIDIIGNGCNNLSSILCTFIIIF